MKDSIVDFSEWHLAPVNEWMTDLQTVRTYASGELAVSRELTDRRLWFYFWVWVTDFDATYNAALEVQLLNGGKLVGNFPLVLTRLTTGSLRSGRSTTFIADRQAGSSLGSFNVERRPLTDLDLDLPMSGMVGPDVRQVYHAAYGNRFITTCSSFRLRVACDCLRIVWSEWAISYTNHYSADLYLACLSQDPRA